MKPAQAHNKLIRIQQDLHDMLGVVSIADYTIQRVLCDLAFVKTVIAGRIKAAPVRSRTTDPDTSKQAEKKSSYKAGSSRARIVQLLRDDRFLGGNGLTVSEAAHCLQIRREAVGRRMSEIAKDSGRRRANKNGYNEVVWILP